MHLFVLGCCLMKPEWSALGIAVLPSATLIPVLAHILWMPGLVCLDSLPSCGLCWLIADCAKSKMFPVYLAVNLSPLTE